MYNTSSLSERAKYITGTFLGNDLRLSKGNEGSDRTQKRVNWLNPSLPADSKSDAEPLLSPLFLSFLSPDNKSPKRSALALLSLHSSFSLPIFYSYLASLILIIIHQVDVYLKCKTSQLGIHIKYTQSKRYLAYKVSFIGLVKIGSPPADNRLGDGYAHLNTKRNITYEYNISVGTLGTPSNCIVHERFAVEEFLRKLSPFERRGGAVVKPPLPQRKYPEALGYNKARQQGYIATNKFRIEIECRGRKNSPRELSVLYRYQGRCFVCGIEEWRAKTSLHLHRVIPGKLGGLYTLDNVVPVCRKCHKDIEGKTWDELNLLQSPETKWAEVEEAQP